MEEHYDWEPDFPKGYGHTSIAYLKRCEGYAEAKNGDWRAAEHVICKCVKWDRIHALRRLYPNAICPPVVSRNMLPFALAKAIGLPVYTGLRLLRGNKRKEMSAMERLLHKPVFLGRVPRDRPFILVDDIVTQGGTVAALRKKVLSQGGKVVAVAALAYSIGSIHIATSEGNIEKFLERYDDTVLLPLLKSIGVAHGLQELTNSQIAYLLRFKRYENILRKISRYQFAFLDEIRWQEYESRWM